MGGVSLNRRTPVSRVLVGAREERERTPAGDSTNEDTRLGRIASSIIGVRIVGREATVDTSVTRGKEMKSPKKSKRKRGLSKVGFFR